jgi:hypothetical protein
MVETEVEARERVLEINFAASLPQVVIEAGSRIEYAVR